MLGLLRPLCLCSRPLRMRLCSFRSTLVRVSPRVSLAACPARAHITAAAAVVVAASWCVSAGRTLPAPVRAVLPELVAVALAFPARVARALTAPGAAITPRWGSVSAFARPVRDAVLGACAVQPGLAAATALLCVGGLRQHGQSAAAGVDVLASLLRDDAARRLLRAEAWDAVAAVAATCKTDAWAHTEGRDTFLALWDGAAYSG